MHRTHDPKRSGSGSSSVISVAGAGQFTHSSILGDRVEVVDEVSSIGPSGIVGYVISPPTPSIHYFTSLLTDITLFCRTRDPKKKKQIIIPLVDNNFDSKDSKSSVSSSNEPYIPKELREDPNEASTAPKSTAPPRKDPYEGVYGLIAPGASSSKSNKSQASAPLLSRSRPKGWREIEEDRKSVV